MKNSILIEPVLQLDNVNVRYLGRPILRNISFALKPYSVSTIVGPSGAGKSTLLRTINRLIDEEEGFQRTGNIRLMGQIIDSGGIGKDQLRQTVGMVFQKPIIFPISIFRNAIFGVHHLGLATKKDYRAIVEAYLKKAFLWDEVKDRLHRPALELSVGQQQRLSIARSLAVTPKIILMDEPTSALDEHATQKIEELILSLKKEHSLLLVTHNLNQARNVSDQILTLSNEKGAGELTSFLQ